MPQEMASHSRALTTTFNEEEVNLLIDAVEATTMLWDASNPDYKSRNKRDNAWQEISDNTFGGKFTVNELQLKWQNVRTQFKAYYAKSIETKSGQAAKNPVTWKYFNKMMFIQSADESQTPVSVSNLVSFKYLCKTLQK